MWHFGVPFFFLPKKHAMDDDELMHAQNIAQPRASSHLTPADRVMAARRQSQASAGSNNRPGGRRAVPVPKDRIAYPTTRDRFYTSTDEEDPHDLSSTDFSSTGGTQDGGRIGGLMGAVGPVLKTAWNKIWSNNAHLGDESRFIYDEASGQWVLRPDEEGSDEEYDDNEYGR